MRHTTASSHITTTTNSSAGSNERCTCSQTLCPVFPAGSSHSKHKRKKSVVSCISHSFYHHLHFFFKYFSKRPAFLPPCLPSPSFSSSLAPSLSLRRPYIVPFTSPDLDGGRWRHSRGSLSPPPRQQRKQPLPRRVRFKLDDNDKTINTTSDQPVQLWDGEQRAAIQESALLALGMMSPAAERDSTMVVHGKRRSFGEAAAAAAT